MALLKEFTLAGRTALITGAGRGIGKGIAEVFAEAGATVVLNSLTEQHLVPLARKLADRTGRRVVPIAADVANQDSVFELFGRAEKEVGPLDIVVSNLGDSIATPILPEGGTTLDAHTARRLMDLNLTSGIYCAQKAAEHMKDRGGKLIFISGFAALRGRARFSVYAAAKAGLIGLTRSLAVELAPHRIQVNTIAPGSFPDITTVGEREYQASVERAKTGVPLGRVGQLREVGLLALYLASAASDYMTGQVLPLDGGTTA
jgi:gluconate 5-dehydrogenase